MLKITDDSGFLAIVVPATYSTFVDENWKLKQLFDHFRAQMAQRSLLIWGTGLEGDWRIDLRLLPSAIKGFREVSGPIRVAGGALLATNYESLTYAAQFADSRLPLEHEASQLKPLADGEYCCRIIQMFDPKKRDSAEGDDPDFVIEFSQPANLPETWSKVPWFDDDVSCE